MRALAAAVVLLLIAGVAHAADWSGVRPGETTESGVRTQFGQATKVASHKLEGYDSVQWVYEGEQAPRGMARVTVDFGLLTPQGYRPEIVRAMRLEPKPGIFTRSTVLAGWGMPQRVGKDKDVDVFFYESGLLIYFDKAGWLAEAMLFTPPQRSQRPAEGAAPPPR